MKKLLAAATVVASVIAVAAPAGAATAKKQAPPSGGAATVTTLVAGGLDNPRGIALGPGHRLLVAEAGRGGDECITAQDPESGEDSTVCVGPTGRVSSVDDRNGNVSTFLGGLPSLAGEDGSGASGPADVAVHGMGNVTVVVQSATGLVEQFTDPSAGLFGKLLSANPSGRTTTIADLSFYEGHANPDQAQIDSDPYGVALAGGTRYVADAGANDVLAVGPNGAVSTVAVLPPTDPQPVPFPPGAIPAESVPTSVVVGPDGALYVGELTGFPFGVGTSRVWRIVPGQAPTVYATGLTNVVDIAFAGDGSLYALEITHHGLDSGDFTGGLMRIPPGGGTAQPVIVDNPALIGPGGMVIDGNTIYATTGTVFPGGGGVVKITL